MAPVTGHNWVADAARRQCTDDRSFRPVAQMRMPTNNSWMFDECALDAFFKLPDP